MKKIAILGCENSHADNFLDYLIKNEAHPDVEVVGVYSDDTAAAERLHDIYGVNVATDYADFVGKIDGLVITARHGDNHYKYAKPYLDSGIPMFLDKPITVSGDEAIELMNIVKEKGIKVTGGSSCIYSPYIQFLKKAVAEKTYGEVFGGFLRFPINMNNPYGDFYFYAQHLVHVTMEIFGYYPNSVKAYQNDKVITCILRYDDYDVTMEYVDGNYVYYASVSCEKQILGDVYTADGCADTEFDEFYDILTGKEQPKCYEDVFQPVMVMNAIELSMKNGTEEIIKKLK